MLTYLLYFLIGAGPAFLLGLLYYRRWDNKQSGPIIDAIRDANWLSPARESSSAAPLTAQQSFDYASRYGTALRGVFAAPTPVKLERLNELLASPHNLEDRLWRDMPMRLKDVYKSYPKEYAVLLETVADNASHPVQLYAAYRLASCLPGAPSEIANIATYMSTNDAIAEAKRMAAGLRNSSS